MKIGYIGGTFDLFHAGHVAILRRAAKMCDRLIVGVTTDEAAELYKRKPTCSWNERVAVVSAIDGVDAVVPQHTRDKVAMWELLKYDVLFFGSDWADTPEFQAYTKELYKKGVTSVILPYTKEISTTEILKRIHDA